MSSSENIAADRPEEKNIFYGWFIVAIGFLVQLALSTTLSSTLGVFFKPMSDEFGWPRSYLSSVKSFESLFGGVLTAFLGPTLDRYGVRVVMVVGAIVTGIGFILLGRINDALQFFLARGIVVCVGAVGIASMVTSVAISNWFVRRRGRAIGMSGAGLPFGKIFLAPTLTILMGIWSWRDAWGVLGLMVLVLVPIPAAIIIRRRPEDMGLRPDGVRQSVTPTEPSPVELAAPDYFRGETLWTRGEAIRTSALWLIILTFGIANIGSQGLALHTIPYLTDIGFTPTFAATCLSILAVFQLGGTLGWGFIVERFPIRYCAMIMFIAEATSVAMILWLRTPVLIILGLCIYGFSLSGNSVLQDIIWANYFGRLSLGAIRSVGMPLLVLFSAGGPLYFGYLYDVTGGYQIALLGFMAALLISAVLVLACHPPKRKAQAAVS